MPKFRIVILQIFKSINVDCVHMYTGSIFCLRFPVELGTVLFQIGQAEDAKQPTKEFCLRPRLSEKEKFKCNCKEMEIADTLLTRAIAAFRDHCRNAEKR